MTLTQRDVVEVAVDFQGKTAPHPVIIISIQDVNDYESTFNAIPISHSPHYYSEIYSFPLYNEDFSTPLKYQDSFARIHYCTLFTQDQLVTKKVLNRMKKEPFQKMMEEYFDKILGVPIQF